MTKLLEKAFAEAAKLPESEQDEVAQWLMAELEAETRWAQAFDSSADALAKMARKALEEHDANETVELDPERL
jgi:hypothetical protein